MSSDIRMPRRRGILPLRSPAGGPRFTLGKTNRTSSVASVAAWTLTPVTPTYHHIYLDRPTIWTGLPVSRRRCVGGVRSKVGGDKCPAGYARRIFRLLRLFSELPWWCGRAGLLPAAILSLTDPDL